MMHNVMQIPTSDKKKSRQIIRYATTGEQRNRKSTVITGAAYIIAETQQ